MTMALVAAFSQDGAGEVTYTYTTWATQAMIPVAMRIHPIGRVSRRFTAAQTEGERLPGGARKLIWEKSS